MSLDLTNLRTLGAVIESGSFAAAGRALGYTASAVSQQMSALERSLGLELFKRSPRKIIPTDAALYLADQAVELLAFVEQLHTDISRWSAGQVGRIRVGSFASAGGTVLVEAVNRFLVRRRGVEISLDEGEPYDLFPRVASGELDVALGFQYDLVPQVWDQNVQLTTLMEEQLYVLAPLKHRLASKQVIDLRELRHERWIAHTPETAASDCLTTFCGTAGFQPEIAFRSNIHSTVQGIIASGLAVGMVPELAHTDPERVIALPLRQRTPRRQIVVATHVGRKGPLTEAFLEALKDAAEKFPHSG